MHKSLVFLSVLLGAAHASPSGGSVAVAAAWYSGWNADVFPVEKISWDKYTHVAYSFAETTDSVHSVSLDSSMPKALPGFVKAAHDHGVKALVSMGGWSGSKYFSLNVGDATNRTAFVKTVTDFASQHGLDGVEFDWEYPGLQGVGCNIISPSDTANFLSFLKELRASPVGAKLILAAAAPMAPWKDASGHPANLAEFSSVLNYVTIMNYDIWGGWSSGVGPNSALDDTCAIAANQQGSAVSALRAWKAAGFPANQMILGVPGYGRSYLVDKANAISSDDKTLAAYPAFDKTLPKGDSTDAEGSGTDICGVPEIGYTGIWRFTALFEEGWLDKDGHPESGILYKFDNCSQTPYLYNLTSQIMISYDDARSFKAKGKFIKSHGLLGFALWETTYDHKTVLLDAIRSGAGFKRRGHTHRRFATRLQHGVL